MLLSPERTLRRKVQEIILARQLSQKLSKEEILALYLNQIYYGHGRYGCEEAARYYFGKSVRDVEPRRGGAARRACRRARSGSRRASTPTRPRPASATCSGRWPSAASSTARPRSEVAAPADPARARAGVGARHGRRRRSTSSAASARRALGDKAACEAGLTVHDHHRRPPAGAGARVARARARGSRRAPGLPRAVGAPRGQGARHATRAAAREARTRRRASRTREHRRGRSSNARRARTRADAEAAASCSSTSARARCRSEGVRRLQPRAPLRARGPSRSPSASSRATSCACASAPIARAPRAAPLPLALELGPQAAMVVMDPHTREVLALVGGYDYHAGGVRSRRARRTASRARRSSRSSTRRRSSPGRSRPATIVNDAPEVYELLEAAELREGGVPRARPRRAPRSRSRSTPSPSRCCRISGSTRRARSRRASASRRRIPPDVGLSLALGSLVGDAARAGQRLRHLRERRACRRRSRSS